MKIKRKKLASIQVKNKGKYLWGKWKNLNFGAQ